MLPIPHVIIIDGGPSRPGNCTSRASLTPVACAGVSSVDFFHEGFRVSTVPEALKLAEEALQAGDRARAAFIYEQIQKVAPDEPQSLNGLGVVATHADRLDEAERFLRRAITIWPSDAAFHNNLSEVYRRQERWEDAVACCRRAIELAPRAAQLHNNLGVLEKQRRQFDAALASFQRGIELDPRDDHIHYNLANLYNELHRLDDAEAAFRRALELSPDSHDIHNNIANVLEVRGRWREAMDHLNASLRLRGDYAQAHRNRALLRLQMGNFAEGWPEYEWRWQVPGAPRLDYPQPRWAGGDLLGRTILLCAEQGLGDTLQFIRYASLVQQRGARVILQCPDMLHAILSRTAGIDRFAAGEGSLERFDYYAPLLSLPAILGTTLQTIPAAIPYLFADPDRVAKTRAALADVGGLRVGIAWQGSRGFAGDHWRSVPLSSFAPVAQVQGVTLFSLQRGFGREQLSAVAEAWRVKDLDDRADQDGAFVDTAALVMNLDLVITTDTAIAHLAGGLGVTVWVALPYSPNWRWLVDRTDSPWYPTMRLFRQTRFADWSDVFRRIAAELPAMRDRCRPR
jgi:Flp pilus assembly protein TadD